MTTHAHTFDGLDRLTWPAITDFDAFIDAWRQAHHAAQAVSEAGKGWSKRREDDGHSALTFEDGRLWSMPAVNGGVRSALLFAPLSLRVGSESLDLDGRTRENGLAWVRERMSSEAGDAQLETVAAPDLPEHRVGTGAHFETGDRDAFERLGELYATAHAMLVSVTRALPDTPEVLCWPHHFDIAALHIARRDEGGAMASTIGYGLAVPDAIEPSGYLYVSGWSRGRTLEPDATSLRWEGSMALLALRDLASDDAARRVSSFVNGAHRALIDAIGA